MRSSMLSAVIVAAALYAASAEASDDIPTGYRGKYRFLRKQFYDKRPNTGAIDDRMCYSFDFSSNPEEDDYFEFCEGVVGSSDDAIECNFAKMDKIRNEDEMFCSRFVVKGEDRYMWCQKGSDQQCAMASSCDGEPILTMYQSEVRNGMCGRIPDAYLNQFRFIDTDNNDMCYSFTFDGDQPEENETITLSDNSYDICTGGDKTCTPSNTFTVNWIHSTIEDDSANWTCVDMYLLDMNGDNSQYYLWLREGDFLQAFLSTDSEHACATNSAPEDSALYVNQSMQCPVLKLANEFNFNPETFDDANRSCVSFDFTNSMGIGANTQAFRWCISNETVKAQCRQTAITSLDIIPKDDQTDYDEFWFCVEFQGYETKKFDDGEDSLKTRYLAVDGEGGAAAFIDSCDDLDHPDDIPNQQNDLTTGRCRSSKWEDVTDNGITRFLDFDGICHYFNNSYNPTGGGNSGRLMYSQFRYCTNGIENWPGSYDNYPALRQCDSSATYQYIKEFPFDADYSDFVCVKFNAENGMSEKNHLWVDTSSGGQNEAVLAADCETPPKDFRWTSAIHSDGYCEVLPEAFTGSAQHFRASSNYCHSFKFDPLILTHDQAYTSSEPRDDKDLFVYCSGTGGVQNCTTNVSRNAAGQVETFYASIQDFEVKVVGSRVWYCVEFDFTFYDSSGSPSPRYLWLHEGVDSDGVGENRAYISDGSEYSCDSSDPSDPWGNSNPLRDGAHCPVIPDEAVGKLRWNQGSENHWFSADLQGNPGRGSDATNEDNFNICEFSGHCYEADLNLVNYTDGNFDDVCLSISYTSTYGLSESRAIIIDDDGDEAVLANDCSGSGLQDISDGLVHRLPGELQKKISFWQRGTCVSFDFSKPPSEQDPTELTYCEGVRANNWCVDLSATTGSFQLESIVNPDDEDAAENWYCATISYPSAYGIDDYRYVWLNPHYYGWNNGTAVMESSCSGSTPPNNFDLNDPDSHGDFLIRDGDCGDYPDFSN